jgi:hypothetical protein
VIGLIFPGLTLAQSRGYVRRGKKEGLRGNTVKKQFFFEKKNQKTFVSWLYIAVESRDSDVLMPVLEAVRGIVQDRRAA